MKRVKQAFARASSVLRLIYLSATTTAAVTPLMWPKHRTSIGDRPCTQHWLSSRSRPLYRKSKHSFKSPHHRMCSPTLVDKCMRPRKVEGTNVGTAKPLPRTPHESCSKALNAPAGPLRDPPTGRLADGRLSPAAECRRPAAESPATSVVLLGDS